MVAVHFVLAIGCSPRRRSPGTARGIGGRARSRAAGIRTSSRVGTRRSRPWRWSSSARWSRDRDRTRATPSRRPAHGPGLDDDHRSSTRGLAAAALDPRRRAALRARRDGRMRALARRRVLVFLIVFVAQGAVGGSAVAHRPARSCSSPLHLLGAALVWVGVHPGAARRRHPTLPGRRRLQHPERGTVASPRAIVNPVDSTGSGAQFCRSGSIGSSRRDSDCGQECRHERNGSLRQERGHPMSDVLIDRPELDEPRSVRIRLVRL